MRSLIFSTLLAMLLALTGVLTFAADNQDEGAQTSESIEQNKDPDVDAQQESGDMNAEEYIVKKGDTLAGIAETFLGTQEKWQEIAKANDLGNPDQIDVGDRLLIPDASGNKKDELDQEPNEQKPVDTPDAAGNSDQMDETAKPMP